MTQKTLLVTGAAGMVGSYLGDVFRDYNLILTDIKSGYPYLNIEDRGSVQEFISGAKPDYVLHLAAATDVDRCEKDAEWAFRVNTEATRNMTLACRKSGIPMVYVSTGAVFDGKKESPYIETDPVSPSNKYGISKWEAEKVVTSLLDRSYIIRASWMIGGGRNDKKFVGKIMQKIMSGERHVKAVNDKFGNISYAKDLLYGIRQLIERDKFGLYHMTNGGGLYSRYDIAVEIVSILNEDKIKVSAVSSDEFPLPAPRGRSEALENHKLNLIDLNFMRPWKEALREYVTGELLSLYR